MILSLLLYLGSQYLYIYNNKCKRHWAAKSHGLIDFIFPPMRWILSYLFFLLFCLASLKWRHTACLRLLLLYVSRIWYDTRCRCGYDAHYIDYKLFNKAILNLLCVSSVVGSWHKLLLVYYTYIWVVERKKNRHSNDNNNINMNRFWNEFSITDTHTHTRNLDSINYCQSKLIALAVWYVP